MIADVIAEKLDLIDALYPPERVAKSKERLTRLWHGESPLDRYPFTYLPFNLDYYSPEQQPELCLQRCLDEIIVRGVAQDDFIPSFFPGCRQSTMPSLFGVEEIEMDGDYSSHRILDSPESFDRLPAPFYAPGTVAANWLHMEEFVLEATGGRLAVHPTDMQGPADACGKMFGYEALLACAYEEPERYHRLMSHVTEAFIGYWEAQRRLCGTHFVGTHLWAWNWVPADAGASVSVDSVVMVSPTFYQEFYQPYLQRIGEVCGGIAVHSCGDFSRVIPVLCATPTMKALNAGEMSPLAMHDAGVDGNTIMIASTGYEALPEVLQRMRTHHLRMDLNIYGIWPATSYGAKPVQEWNAEDRAEMQRKEDVVLNMLAVGCA